jgi:hypothetical protein
MFGTTGTGVIGGGHLIANFPTPVHGAAANMENLRRHYLGLTIDQAMRKWSGGSRAVPGPLGHYDPRTVITEDMLNDSNFMIPFMKAVASGEAPGRYPMTQEQWDRAFEWYRAGKPLPMIPTQPGADTSQPGAETSRLDNSLGNTSGVVKDTGRLTVNVDAPRGTKATAEGDGVFSETKVNRTIKSDRLDAKSDERPPKG